MRIGISVLSHEGQNIWENGLGQNVFFLAQLLQRLPFVSKVLLIDVGDQTSMPPQVESAAFGFARVPRQEATDLVDVVIEMAGALDPQWLRLLRARGKKVVYLCCGQPYAALVEPSVFDKVGPSLAIDRCDEIWLLPKDEAFVPLMRTLFRCPVEISPFIWHPKFVDQRIAEVQGLIGHEFGYQPRQPDKIGRTPGFRVAVFEPNISVVKTSSIPMLVCDEAYRVNPNCIDFLSVLNTLHMTTHPTMLYLANSLDLVKQHKMVFLGRHDIVGFMTEKADAVVSHQWRNSQNYSYLDALYGNYPLIHNSPWLHDLAGAGYYYPGFEAAEGGRQLQLAFESHDANLGDYKVRSQKVFQAVNPFSDANMAAYAVLLTKLCRGTAFEVTA